jgi:hypothetical protein
VLEGELVTSENPEMMRLFRDEPAVEKKTGPPSSAAAKVKERRQSDSATVQRALGMPPGGSEQRGLRMTKILQMSPPKLLAFWTTQSKLEAFNENAGYIRDKEERTDEPYDERRQKDNGIFKKKAVSAKK